MSPHQPELRFDLESDGERATARAARRVGGSLRRLLARTVGPTVYWAPVWVPLALLVQIGWLGLGRALGEARRLDGEEARLAMRASRLADERTELERVERALTDEIYLERLRRASIERDRGR